MIALQPSGTFAVLSRGPVVGSPDYVVGYSDDLQLAFRAARALQKHDACWGEAFAVVIGDEAARCAPLPAERTATLTAVSVSTECAA